MQPIEKRQLELEYDSIAEGENRIQKMIKNAPFAESAAGQRILSKSFQRLCKVIAIHQRYVEVGARIPHGVALVSVEAEKLAFITLKAILLGMGAGYSEGAEVPVTRLARDIGRFCEWQRKIDIEQGGDRNLIEALANRNKNPWNARKRAEATAQEFNNTDWALAKLDFHLGGALLEMALKSSDLFTRNTRPKSASTISLSKKAIRQINQLLREQKDFVLPFYLPMIMPPRPWKGTEGGGYLLISPGLIKERTDFDPDQVAEPKGLALPCEVVNALQETPWRIHRQLAETFLKVHEHQDAQHASTDKDLRDELNLAFRVSTCKRLLEENELYFPHQIDWRGRAYPVPPIIHTQGDDSGRALLQFARGKPLGEKGRHWLAVHLANLYGENKQSFTKRVEWVEKHRDAILDSARRPIDGSGFWKKADKPWRFLAAAMEWAEALNSPDSFLSHTPIAMDGTCNGLQHLSALGRDPEGGAWTNLAPNTTPQDIYQEVANRLTGLLKAESANHPTMATRWLSLVTRGLVKQATMTTPYGVTRQGIQKQLLSVIGDKSTFPNTWSANVWLGPRIQEAIAQVVVKAAAITAWLRVVADRFSRKGLGIAWVAPSGMHLEQSYKKPKARRIKTAIGTLLIYEPDSKGKPNRRKQKDAIVPNLIHSLDAAHMMLTVRDLYSRGLRDFAMVHDSYAVHACDVDAMNETLRSTFVQIHTDLTLGKLSLELQRQAPKIDIPLPPATGSLEIKDVQQSEYFFS